MKNRTAEPVDSRATLADIVRESGMSRSTVSRALTGKGYVSPDKKELILETAEKLGYRASALARALRTQQSMTLGVLVADIANPLFPAIVKGIDEVVSAAGYTLFLCNTDENSQRQQALIRSLLDRHIDGLVLVSQTLNDASRKLLKNGPPCVFVNRMPATVKSDYIGPDNVQAINLLLEHLHSLGHRHIACITGPMQSSTARERKEAYLAGMRRLNCSVQPGYLIEGNYHGSSGKKAIAQLLRCQPQPTAVLAANDFVALELINGLTEQGIAVPDHISVCGFDDAFSMHYNALSRLQEKGLTTIDQPKRELGQAAARALLARIDNPHRAMSRTILPVTLQVRNTSGKA
ncbi:LacI family DNA-binding transcriptional regulator [Pantoea sp.]|uniref:LacI family DNA-binding transcriptional regulator n=1 Tax=Pantoea sp. TaxID=69393 RepID=UPI00289921C5|nr:LacI family DNA-binding transcriptional regulator [Pantoea sp.]